MQDADPLAYQTRPLTLSLRYTRQNALREGILTLEENGAISLRFTQPQSLAGITVSRSEDNWEITLSDGGRIPFRSDEPLSDPAVLEALFSLTEEQLICTETDGKGISSAVYQTDFGPVTLCFAEDRALPISLEAPELEITVTLSDPPDTEPLP